METLFFIIIWLGGASLHTLIELNSKKCCSAGISHKAGDGEKCVKCRTEW